MWVVRAVQLEDLDALHQLVQSATRGLTSLQLNRARLLERIEESTFAFRRSAPFPRGEPYVLVLVNEETGELAGTSTVYAKTGGYQPFYAYRIVGSDHYSAMLGVRHHRVRLELHRIHDGPTEIGSLFLRGHYRGEGRGRWLSVARFALISMLPHRFADRVIAEMRGKALSDGTVPFWDAVAGRFIPADFALVDALSTVSKQFIEEMMPQHPIYLDLLPESVTKGIGQVHQETVPALAMLKAEGFTETDLVDIFDAGPVVCCDTAQIDAVKRSQTVTVKDVVDVPDDGSRDPKSRVIVASNVGGFTSVMTHVQFEHGEVVVDSATARRLELERGSTCTVMAPRPVGSSPRPD